jgi:hypothetical protein
MIAVTVKPYRPPLALPFAEGQYSAEEALLLTVYRHYYNACKDKEPIECSPCFQGGKNTLLRYPPDTYFTAGWIITHCGAKPGEYAAKCKTQVRCVAGGS